MELLIIKAGAQYIRVKPEGIFTVNLDKASVFPMDRMAHVRHLEQDVRQKGFEAVSVKKLVLSEEEIS
jgi:hypothetical protein